MGENASDAFQSMWVVETGIPKDCLGSFIYASGVVPTGHNVSDLICYPV